MNVGALKTSCRKVRGWRLWVLVIGVAGCCGIRAASERLRLPPLSPPRHLTASPPTVGSFAPDFTLSDYDGKAYRLSDFRGKRVLLNFFCGCGPCQRLAQEWQDSYSQQETIQVLSVTTVNPGALRSLHVYKEITYPLLFDVYSRVARLYRSTDCPRCWVIDVDGKIRYRSPSPLKASLEKAIAHVKREVTSGGCVVTDEVCR